MGGVWWQRRRVLRSEFAAKWKRGASVRMATAVNGGICKPHKHELLQAPISTSSILNSNNHTIAPARNKTNFLLTFRHEHLIVVVVVT
jgi:hypothetical protein